MCDLKSERVILTGKTLLLLTELIGLYYFKKNRT